MESADHATNPGKVETVPKEGVVDVSDSESSDTHFESDAKKETVLNVPTVESLVEKSTKDGGIKDAKTNHKNIN
jgi:hypothetical protein